MPCHFLVADMISVGNPGGGFGGLLPEPVAVHKPLAPCGSLVVSQCVLRGDFSLLCRMIVIVGEQFPGAHAGE